jgi:hypothetical protein
MVLYSFVCLTKAGRVKIVWKGFRDNNRVWYAPFSTSSIDYLSFAGPGLAFDADTTAKTIELYFISELLLTVSW